MATDATEKKKILKMPHQFSAVQLRVIQNLLVLGLPYDNAVQSFLDKFPEVMEDYELNDALTQEERDGITEEQIELEIRSIVRKRFKEMRYNKRRESYDEIVQKKEMIAAILNDAPVMDPLQRIKELEIMRQDPSLKHEQRLKIFAAAIREANILIPREHPVIGKGLLTLPDLPIRDPDNDSSPNFANAFGGAMMRAARKKTDEEN